MFKFRLDGANIYVKSGLLFLAIAVVAFASTLFLRPAAESARFLLIWLMFGSFLGGITLYFIGRIIHIANRRGAA